jgi:hypothetical protein
MNYSGVPIIVALSYIAGELYKAMIKDEEHKRLIPVLMAIVGAVLSIAIYYSAPEIMAVDTIWDAIMVGIVSGESATGANQIIKQLFKNQTIK